MKKKLISIILALALTLAIVPASAYALSLSDLLGGSSKKTSSSSSILSGLLGGNSSSSSSILSGLLGGSKKSSSTSDLTSLLSLLGGGTTNSSDLTSLLSLLGGGTTNSSDLTTLLSLLGGGTTSSSDLTSLLSLLGGGTTSSSDVSSLLSLLGASSSSDLASLLGISGLSSSEQEALYAAILEELQLELLDTTEEEEDDDLPAIKCDKDTTCPLSTFLDLSTTAWYHDGIHYCVEKGLINGFPGNLYKPQDQITRGQLITIIYRLAGNPEVKTTLDYEDVAKDDSNSWYKDAAIWAKENEISDGRDAKNFGSSDPLAREEFADILYRFSIYKKINTTSILNEGNPMAFSDTAKISDWALMGMKFCINAEIISGDNNGKLNPQGTTTRAEAATMLYRYCNKFF